MGKKRVAQKGDLVSGLKTGNVKETSSKKKVSRGIAFIQSTYNNTIVSLADLSGSVLAWSSSGSLGFKGAKKATPYAATLVSKTVVEKVKKTGLEDVKVIVRGVGSGREAAIRGLAAAGLNLVSIKDMTPIPHNGPKRRKPRRV
jgi:small subunit ribosomal protein S11